MRISALSLSLSLIFLGACGSGESKQEKLSKCASLVGQKAAELERAQDNDEALEDSGILACKELFEREYRYFRCSAESRGDFIPFYRCMHEDAELAKKGKDSDPRVTGCGKLYEKFATCGKELGEDGKFIEEVTRKGKNKFVKECQKEFDQAKKMIECVDKVTCGEFFKCALGVDPAELRQNASEPTAPADMPAE